MQPRDGANDLQIEGPYWTGFFSESVASQRRKDRAIKANIFDASTKKTKQPDSDIYAIDVPPSPNLNGYTIGNRANYRLYAMDIKTHSKGRGA